MNEDPATAGFRAALDARPISLVQIRLVILIVLLMLTDGYDVQAIGYAATSIAEDWSLERAVFGPVFSAGLLGLAAGALTLAPVADRIGSRRVLIGCVVWYAVTAIATAFVDSVPALTAMRFITGLGMGGAMPNAIGLISDYSPGRRRTLMITLAVCGFSLGSAFGGLVGAVLLEDFGWRAVFLVGGGAPLLLLPFLIAWLPDSPRRLLSGEAPARLTAALERFAPGLKPQMAPASAAPTAAAPARIPVAGLFAGGLAVPTLLIWLTFFMNLLLLYLLANWLPLLVRGVGFSISQASLITAFYQLGGTAGALVLASLCDRTHPQRVLAAAYLGAAVCLGVLSVAPPEGGLLTLIITVTGFFIVGAQIAANAFAGGYYPSPVRTTGVGWALGVGRFGSIIGPLVGGALLAAGISTGDLFRVAVIPALAACLAILAVRRSPTPQAQPEPRA